MNTPSPLLPQGAIPPRPKNSLYIKILMVLSVHVVVIGGMLLQGCSHTTDQPKTDGTSPLASDTPPVTAAPNTTPMPPPIESAPVTNPSLSSTSYVAPVAANPMPLPPAPNPTSLPAAKSTDLLPPATPGEAKEYVIAKGDTLGAIARKNGLALKTLMEANPNLNAKKLQIGQKVQIPAAPASLAAKEAAPGAVEAAPADGSVYVVKSGDMLLKIAKAHGTTVKKIMAANDLKTTSIRAGQKLKLPAGKPASTEPATVPVKVATAPASGTSVAAN